MDYFSVIVLIVITFVFMTDRKPKSLDNIFEKDKNIYNRMNDIQEKMRIVEKDFEKTSYNDLIVESKDITQKYILFQNNKVKMTENEKQIIVANYINNGYKMSAFNFKYICNSKQSIVKKLYINILNYINIFNKKDISTYAAIILKKEDLKESINKDNIVSYITNGVMTITIDYSKKELEEINKIQIQKLKEGNVEIILKLSILILTGIYITANLLNSIINFNSVQNVLVCLVIYLCYSYVVRYIYEPIGKQRMIAKYMFPIYFTVYLWVMLYNKIKIFIKKVHAS